MISILYPGNGFQAEYFVETKGDKTVETIFVYRESALESYVFVDGELTVYINNGKMSDKRVLGEIKGKAQKHLRIARKEARPFALEVQF